MTNKWTFACIKLRPVSSFAAQMRSLKATFFSPVGHQCFWSCRARVLDSLDTEF